MGFFQSLKDDLSEAVDGLLGEDEDTSAQGGEEKAAAAGSGTAEEPSGMDILNAMAGDVSLDEEDPLNGVDMESLLKSLDEAGIGESDSTEDVAGTQAESGDTDGGENFDEELAKLLADLPTDEESAVAKAEESTDENGDEELAALLGSLPSEAFEDDAADAEADSADAGGEDELMETSVESEEEEDTEAVAGETAETAEAGDFDDFEDIEGIEELEDIEDPELSDEEYTPATAEEIAEFEASSDDEETDGLFASDDLDKLMADIAALQSDENAGEKAADPAEQAVEAAEEAVSETAGSAENAADEAVVDDVSAEGGADAAVSTAAEKVADDAVGAGAEEGADDAADMATADDADDAVSAAVEGAEAVTAPVSESAAPASDIAPAAEGVTSESDTAAYTGGEQMTISQMMEIEEDSSEVIKQAEAMAEAAMIADLEEAAEEEKRAEEEKKEEKREDNKQPKKGRKKAVKIDDTAVITRPVSDETAVFAEGMSVKGNVESDGSLEVCGSIEGDIDIAGKLKVSGIIKGNTTAGELYADGAEINGDICCSGSVKVGQSTIIIGNITGSSAVIAGAVKGDIDVHGPVILDSVAIVMGDIRSQSLQISNGAAVEGMCSQIYSPITPSDFFGGFDKK